MADDTPKSSTSKGFRRFLAGRRRAESARDKAADIKADSSLADVRKVAWNRFKQSVSDQIESNFGVLGSALVGAGRTKGARTAGAYYGAKDRVFSAFQTSLSRKGAFGEFYALRMRQGHDYERDIGKELVRVTTRITKKRIESGKNTRENVTPLVRSLVARKNKKVTTTQRLDNVNDILVRVAEQFRLNDAQFMYLRKTMEEQRKDTKAVLDVLAGTEMGNVKEAFKKYRQDQENFSRGFEKTEKEFTRLKDSLKDVIIAPQRIIDVERQTSENAQKLDAIEQAFKAIDLAVKRSSQKNVEMDEANTPRMEAFKGVKNKGDPIPLGGEGTRGGGGSSTLGVGFGAAAGLMMRKLGKGNLIRGAGLGVAGAGLGIASDELDKRGYRKTATAASIASYGAAGAGFGSLFGPWGTAIGGVVGTGYGVYKNWDRIWGDSITATDPRQINRLSQFADPRLQQQVIKARTQEDIRKNNRLSQVDVIERHMREKEKQRFLAYGKLPEGFEFLPGSQGVLSAPSAGGAIGQVGGLSGYKPHGFSSSAVGSSSDAINYENYRPARRIQTPDGKPAPEPQQKFWQSGSTQFGKSEVNIGKSPGPMSVDGRGRVNHVAYYANALKNLEGSKLIGFVPKDGEKFGITTGSKEEWARFMTQLTKQESNFNVNTIGDGGKSIGLSQMYYGEYGIKDPKDPQQAQRGMIKQFEKYVIPFGSITGRGSGKGTYSGWGGAAAYFGPMRRTNEFFQHNKWMQKNRPAFDAVGEEMPKLGLLTPEALAQKEVKQIPATQYGSQQSADFNVVKSTRNELENRRSTPGDRKVSLDFNATSGRASGGLLVIPNNATEEEVKASQEYIQGLTQMMKDFGYDNYKPHGKGKYGPGIRTTQENRRGVGGYFHTEPFFNTDKKAVEIFSSPEGQKKYSELLARTLGKVKGTTFIPPHEEGTRNTGAAVRIGDKNYSEIAFAKKYIIPHLEKIKEESKKAKEQPAQSTPPESKEKSVTQEPVKPKAPPVPEQVKAPPVTISEPAPKTEKVEENRTGKYAAPNLVPPSPPTPPPQEKKEYKAEPVEPQKVPEPVKQAPVSPEGLTKTDNIAESKTPEEKKVEESKQPEGGNRGTTLERNEGSKAVPSFTPGFDSSAPSPGSQGLGSYGRCWV